jgi:hypothetical protein
MDEPAQQFPVEPIGVNRNLTTNDPAKGSLRLTYPRI